mmetsp:Transcript_30313/g.61823  ORF Transcript_30313/g.61823 Transcript_30313/m.61823 type:complete len:268 (-) Transcript_30313:352-1155(-)
MASETSALLTASDAAKLQVAGQALSELATEENAVKAAKYTTGKIQHAYSLATDASTPLRVLALISGIAMMGVSIFTFTGKLSVFHVVDAVLSVYCIFFGMLIIILEGKWIPCQKRCQAKIRKYMLFLDYVWGRGLLYMFAGSLQLIQFTLFDIPIGGYTVFIGFSYYVNGLHTSRKLSDLRKSLYNEEELRRRFAEVDVTNSGEMDYAHFAVFVQNLGLVLTRNEMEAAFYNIDLDHNTTIEFEEFLLWWRQWDFDDVERGKVKVKV